MCFASGFFTDKPHLKMGGSLPAVSSGPWRRKPEKELQTAKKYCPMTIDSQYQVGFTWARQYGFRVVKDFGGKFALGLPWRDRRQPSAGAVSLSLQQRLWEPLRLPRPGMLSSLLRARAVVCITSSTPPDTPSTKHLTSSVKAVADPGYGHYELFGIISTFRNRVYPCGVVGTNANDTAPPATPTQISLLDQWFLYAEFHWRVQRYAERAVASERTCACRCLIRRLEFAVQGAAGDGIGRYGSAQLADITLRPDGTQALIRTAHGLGELVLHPTPKLDIYADFGAEYAWRAAYQGLRQHYGHQDTGYPCHGHNGSIPATTTTASS